jgi:serine acetyltransferase
MTSHWSDYVLSSLAIGLLLACAGGLLWLAHPWLVAALGSHHVLADLALGLLAYGLLSALLLRLLLRWRPMPLGAHGPDAAAFTYWKLLNVVYRLGQASIGWCLPFFLRPLRDALFGARIGPDVAFGGTIDDPFLVTVGAGTVLGNASLVTGNYLSGGKLVCQPVHIGSGVTVGANAIVMPGVTIGDGATVMSGAVVMPGTTVPAGESWRGNPARKWA